MVIQRYGGIGGTGPYGGAYGGTVPIGPVVAHGAVGTAYGTYGGAGDMYSGYGTHAPCGSTNSSTQELPANWNSSVLRLRGMPFNANEHHIVVGCLCSCCEALFKRALGIFQ